MILAISLNLQLEITLLSINSGATAIVPLPSFGKFTVHLRAGSLEAMMDVTKVGRYFTIFGIVGDSINVVYATTSGNDLALTFSGAGVLTVDVYSQLASTSIQI